MKWTLLNILLLINILVYGSSYNHCSNYYNRSNNIPTQYEYRRIGYTTNYSNGNFNSSVYQTHSNFGYTTLHRNNYTTVHTYSGTYHPGNTSRPGASHPRRVTVYNGSGETDQTPGGNSDSSDWLYMQDGDGNWYCSKDGGITWYKWEEKSYGSGILGWLEYLGDLFAGTTETWSTTPTTPPENSSHWASDPDDPFLTPVGEFPISLLLIMIFGYAYYKKKKNEINTSI